MQEFIEGWFFRLYFSWRLRAVYDCAPHLELLVFSSAQFEKLGDHKGGEIVNSSKRSCTHRT